MQHVARYRSDFPLVTLGATCCMKYIELLSISVHATLYATCCTMYGVLYIACAHAVIRQVGLMYTCCYKVMSIFIIRT